MLKQYQPSSGDLFVILPPIGMIFTPEFSQADVHVWGDDVRNYSKKYLLIFHYKPGFKGVERMLYFLCRDRIPKGGYNAYIFLGKWRGGDGEKKGAFHNTPILIPISIPATFPRRQASFPLIPRIETNPISTSGGG